ncbi:MAG TPA: hypothetical protein VGN01_11470 [Acidobacteriaceae bacterium]
MSSRLFPAIAMCLALVASTQAQMPPMPGMDQPSPATNSSQNPGAMPGMSMDMDMPGMPGMRLMHQMPPHNFLEEIQHHASAGTSAEPNSTPSPMVMGMHGPWMTMLHGNAFVADTQQSGPRGADKFFSTNWLMPMAQRELGPGQVTLRAMFSAEPATITGRQYPLLFQQGETAFGKAIVDGQHPHDFFMELAALYDWRISERTLVSIYVAPVGDPALGPTAYPHRTSAEENPVATLGHHQEDSTHIAGDVVTLGVTHGIARVEASGFHGREPNESRWTIQQGAMDSWSLRATVQPGGNWSGQLSYGRLHSPEALFPTEDQERTTASVMYNRPIKRGGDWGNWASTIIWGRTRDSDGGKENSYLLESTLRFARKNSVWTRVENAGRSNELQLGQRVLPAGFAEEPLTHVQVYTFGFDRDLGFVPHISTALGAQVTAYGVSVPLQAVYGKRPVGAVVFLRLRVF